MYNNCWSAVLYVCAINTALPGGSTVCSYVHTYVRTTYISTYISRYNVKRGISQWDIRYIPQFELAVRHLGINHYCSLSHLTHRINWG